MESYLPPSIIEKLEAGAFRSLCSHLKERSDEVQNIDLMTVSGFCRNCLAKWMVMEARKLSEALPKDMEMSDEIVQALNAVGYEEAAKYVYGIGYEEWKKRHSKKANEEQMQKYNDSTHLHHVFDKNILKTRGQRPENPLNFKEGNAFMQLLSNVCCQDVDSLQPPTGTITNKSFPGKKARSLSPFSPPVAPLGGITFSAAVLTVSDRASNGEYESGDLSGPAVQQSVKETVDSLSTSQTPVNYTITSVAIVPDDLETIQAKLVELSQTGVDLILTTGGTGFAPRDVTPEATKGVLDRECPGLISFVISECSRLQPLASLSRGTAGVIGKTIVCNLPGNPKGVGETVPILLPVLIHGIRDLQIST
jgi:gephyrin